MWKKIGATSGWRWSDTAECSKACKTGALRSIIQIIILFACLRRDVLELHWIGQPQLLKSGLSFELVLNSARPLMRTKTCLASQTDTKCVGPLVHDGRTRPPSVSEPHLPSCFYILSALCPTGSQSPNRESRQGANEDFLAGWMAREPVARCDLKWRNTSGFHSLLRVCSFFFTPQYRPLGSEHGSSVCSQVGL